MSAKQKEMAFEEYRKTTSYTTEQAIDRLNVIIRAKEKRFEQNFSWPAWNEHILTWFMCKILLHSQKHNV